MNNKYHDAPKSCFYYIQGFLCVYRVKGLSELPFPILGHSHLYNDDESINHFAKEENVGNGGSFYLDNPKSPTLPWASCSDK